MRGREDVAVFVIVGLLNEMRPRRATMYTSLHVLISDDAHRMLESESYFHDSRAPMLTCTTSLAVEYYSRDVTRSLPRWNSSRKTFEINLNLLIIIGSPHERISNMIMGNAAGG